MRTQRNFDDIQLTHLSRTFGRMVHLRLYLGLLLAAVSLGTALSDPKPWRLGWVGLTLLLAISFFIYEARRFAREGFTPRSIPFNVWVSMLLQSSMVLATGGIASPLLPSYAAMGFIAGIVFRPGQRRGLLLAQLGVLTGMVGVQLSGRWPELPLAYLGPLSRVMLLFFTAVVAALCMGASYTGGILRHTFDGMLDEALAHRDELLATHRAHARELEALSGEIAHELKNPLATVKGLTQLMVREAGQAQPAERLKVLSSEVSRMQGILEEFLNFSRPLVPLAVREVDVAALCDEALVLHEGLAGERGVRLERVGEGPVRAACDPRKVKQVLMNLLHNAIEASPPGGRVTVEVGATASGDARVSLRDEGPGLSPEVDGRAFEAGVTTKERGSGLGLTVARALARQHGGEVTLESGPRGGCVAQLRLPRELPAGALGPLAEVSHG